MQLDFIYNENCMETMQKHIDVNSIDIVLTSPPYNTNKKAGTNRTLLNSNFNKENYPDVRYDVHIDNMTDDEYNDFTVGLFNQFDKILKPNGCVLYNISYGSENTAGMFLAVNAILTRTAFTLADTIVWKKKSALPNNVSPNKLTRVTEFVFVFCRKTEITTFHCNKKMTRNGCTGQPYYENIFNFIEAPNNDEVCPYNKATYSSELCEKLLKIYAPIVSVVYDPFMGSGTTAVACKKLELHYIGSEISKNIIIGKLVTFC